MDQAPGVTRYQRKNFYIDKDFQTRFILKFCAIVVGGALLTMGILYFLALQSTTVSIVNSRVVVMTTADFILPLLQQALLAVTVCVAVAVIAVTLFVSHKIAGPLFRFKQSFKELSQGNFSQQVKLRKGDQLGVVAEDFNHMISVVRSQVAASKQALIDVEKDLEAIGVQNVQEGKRQKYLDLVDKVQVLEKRLQFFRI